MQLEITEYAIFEQGYLMHKYYKQMAVDFFKCSSSAFICATMKFTLVFNERNFVEVPEYTKYLKIMTFEKEHPMVTLYISMANST